MDRGILRHAGREAERTTTPTSEMKPSASTPEEAIEVAYGEVQSGLRAEPLQRVRQNSLRFFEQVIVDLLVAMGHGGSHRNASEHLGNPATVASTE